MWEDRAAKQGRKVPLKVVVVPALASSPEPDPVVMLAGGPGQGAAKLAGYMVPVLERLHRNRDLVFVDQRGTGDSRPLECEPVPHDAPLAQQFDDTYREEEFRKCLAGYDADVRLYTTPIAMDDLDEVREALGYEKLNLYGVSYGTRAALVYLRQHPEHVRTVMLEGVAPMSLLLPLNVARDSQRALDLLFTHCEQDAACAKRYPELRGRFESLLAQLQKEPVRTRVEHPLTGVPEDLTISHDHLRGGAARGALHARGDVAGAAGAGPGHAGRLAAARRHPPEPERWRQSQHEPGHVPLGGVRGGRAAHLGRGPRPRVEGLVVGRDDGAHHAQAVCASGRAASCPRTTASR